MSVIDNFLPKGLPAMVEKDNVRGPVKEGRVKASKAPGKKSGGPKAPADTEVKDRVLLTKPNKFSKADIQAKVQVNAKPKSAKESE